MKEEKGKEVIPKIKVEKENPQDALLKIIEDGRKLPLEARIENMKKNAEILENKANNLQRELHMVEGQLTEIVGALKFAESFNKVY